MGLCRVGPCSSSKQPLNLQASSLGKEIKESLIYSLSGRTSEETCFLYQPAQKFYPHEIIYLI